MPRREAAPPRPQRLVSASAAPASWDGGGVHVVQPAVGGQAAKEEMGRSSPGRVGGGMAGRQALDMRSRESFL